MNSSVQKYVINSNNPTGARISRAVYIYHTYLLLGDYVNNTLMFDLLFFFTRTKLITSVPSARVLKFFTVLGTVLPNRPITILPASSPPIDISK